MTVVSPPDFLDDFQRRLQHLASDRLAGEGGDHVLNPDVGPYAYWTGDPRKAAVLVGITDDPVDPQVILTQRTARLSSHGGQVAFPGGKIDATDRDPVQAALREAEEEIGLDRRFAKPLKVMRPYLTGSGFHVTPVISSIASGYQLEANPAEVDAIFEVPLSFLMNADNHKVVSRVRDDQERFFYEMPFDGWYIWGVTAGIIRSIYDAIYGD